MRILFVAAEVHPYLKVGGLADVAAGLPAALAALGHEVRVLVPGTAAALKAAKARHAKELTSTAGAWLRRGRLLEAPLAGPRARAWLLDTPALRARRGTPYQDEHGRPYPDEALRYDELARCAAAIAAGRLLPGWQPDVVHCNEWHTGLVPVRLMLERTPAACVFTVHNLGYQGLFSAADFAALHLPGWLWHPQALEFYGRLNFMKGGLVFSDRITAVSPGYAREMLTPEFGAGLEGVLEQRRASLTGILNGIDTRAWDPARDPALPANFDAAGLAARELNRRALRREFGLPDNGRLLLAMVARLVPQKGVDILLEALPALLEQPVDLVVLGSGDALLQDALGAAARADPQRLGIRLGHDEGLAHRIYGGCDALLMPSRFEPCGLTQLYAMRYGALPIVHRTGGLADTVRDAAQPQGNGFVFDAPSAAALGQAVHRASAAYAQPAAWRRLIQRAMAADFSWDRSARQYLKVYASAARPRGPY